MSYCVICIDIFDESCFGSKVVFKVQKLSPQYHIISYVFAHNVKPKKSSKKELRHIDLYFQDEMVYQDVPYTSHLPSIITNYLRAVGRSRLGNTCYGFSRLLTRIFETAGVSLEEMHRAHVESMDTITLIVLRFIKMNLGW